MTRLLTHVVEVAAAADAIREHELLLDVLQ